jgi:hypothetical protein
MRPIVLSIGLCICAIGAVCAQNAGGGLSQQVPVGQTFKNFELPFYEDGKLKWSATATQATGITQNRAEAMDVKIKVYDDTGTETMTITSPQADIYVADRKMRSSHTVQIERADMEALAQNCDFDLTNKKYLLRTNVKVTLKNFDPGTSLNPTGSTAPMPTATKPDAPAPSSTTSMTPRAILNSDSLPESPGTASRNSAPIAPTNPQSK